MRKKRVRAVKRTSLKKSPGTVITEKYRRRMNKLTIAERQQLMERALEIAYGGEHKPASARSR